jgi:PqqD family protein of HPr-rel-A system
MKSAELNTWTVPSRINLQWKRWGDEFIVFNPTSGQTHLLNLVAGKALKLLEESPASPSEIIDRLCETTGIESSTEFAEHIRRLFSEFDELGLVELADSPSDCR